LGNGNQISFWDDRWVSDTPLKGKFHRLYSIPLNIESVVSEMGEWVNNDNEDEHRR